MKNDKKYYWKLTRKDNTSLYSDDIYGGIKIYYKINEWNHKPINGGPIFLYKTRKIALENKKCYNNCHSTKSILYIAEININDFIDNKVIYKYTSHSKKSWENVGVIFANSVKLTKYDHCSSNKKRKK